MGVIRGMDDEPPAFILK